MTPRCLNVRRQSTASSPWKHGMTAFLCRRLDFVVKVDGGKYSVSRAVFLITDTGSSATVKADCLIYV